MGIFENKRLIGLGLAAGLIATGTPTTATAASIIFFPNIAPTLVGSFSAPLFKSPSYDAYHANAVAAILDGDTNRGGDASLTPTAFAVTDRVFGSAEALATEFTSWRGNLAPIGVFANELGTQFRNGVRVESSTAFTAFDVKLYHVTPTYTANNDIAQLATRFGDRAVGINYGADGVRGGGDDIVYDNNSFDIYTTKVNLLAFLGLPRDAYLTNAYVDNNYGGDRQAALDDWALYVAGGYGNFTAPFTSYYNYSLAQPGLDTTSATYKLVISDVPSVPEPTTWAMMIFGFGLVGGAMRRRHSVRVTYA